MFNTIIAFVIGLIVISVLGIAQYRIADGKIRRRYNEKMFNFFSIIFAVIVAASMAIWGGRSLVTGLDAVLGTDDTTGFYALFVVAPMAILVVGLFTYAILYYTGCKIGYYRKLKLNDLLCCYQYDK